eukprot:CAMPEP_0170139230 /NCGR_PEP_ID=MMETSP0033_2-20121228/5503_1 /TAXON_ID=195969 /ORGANISM="Dolichomastix tenuilepis, Strain CCMP3274" /LENGTH=90 /DNA_ID=CAMNT_0010375327 /DNA_START=109 /DNA_END=381 /DNA_ORIENTATION=+
MSRSSSLISARSVPRLFAAAASAATDFAVRSSRSRARMRSAEASARASRSSPPGSAAARASTARLRAAEQEAIAATVPARTCDPTSGASL